MARDTLAAVQDPDELAQGLEADRGKIGCFESLGSHTVLRRFVGEKRAQEHVGVDGYLHPLCRPDSAMMSLMSSMESRAPLVLPSRMTAKSLHEPCGRLAFSSARPSGRRSRWILSPGWDAEVLEDLLSEGDLTPSCNCQGGHGRSPVASHRYNAEPHYSPAAVA